MEGPVREVRPEEQRSYDCHAHRAFEPSIVERWIESGFVLFFCKLFGILGGFAYLLGGMTVDGLQNMEVVVRVYRYTLGTLCMGNDGVLGLLMRKGCMIYWPGITGLFMMKYNE